MLDFAWSSEGSVRRVFLLAIHDISTISDAGGGSLPFWGSTGRRFNSCLGGNICMSNVVSDPLSMLELRTRCCPPQVLSIQYTDNCSVVRALNIKVAHQSQWYEPGFENTTSSASSNLQCHRITPNNYDFHSHLLTAPSSTSLDFGFVIAPVHLQSL